MCNGVKWACNWARGKGRDVPGVVYLQVEGFAAAGKTAIRGNLVAVFSLARDHILGDSHSNSDWVPEYVVLS